jgi:hypothetical protein
MNNQDIMCEVEVSDSMVEVVDADHFTSDMHHYDQYDVNDQYEEVTCETEDSQGLMMQTMEDDNGLPCFAEEVILHSEADLQGHEEVLDSSGLPLNAYDVALENEIYIESQAPGPSTK